jgi:CheY-like chemotaxis protein
MGQPARTLQARTLLVVDDDCDVQDALKETLEDDGYEVRCTRNGLEALTYLRLNPAPAAIVLDLFMPTMNGWDFVRHLGQEPRLRGIPVVVLTATLPQRGSAVQHVLRKPVSANQLLSAIREAIAGGSGAEEHGMPERVPVGSSDPSPA